MPKVSTPLTGVCGAVTVRNIQWIIAKTHEEQILLNIFQEKLQPLAAVGKT